MTHDDDEIPLFYRSIAEVLEIACGEPPPRPAVPPRGEQPEWVRVPRTVVVRCLPEEAPWPEALFGAMLRAMVHDPDPSFNRQLVEPTLEAVGRRRLQEALIGLMGSGTNAEKAGAVRAWYWTRVPLRYRGMANLEADIPTEESKREYEAVEDLRNGWRLAALREFVANEDLDLRRCLLPEFSLQEAEYPDDLKELVGTAARIAQRLHIHAR